MCYGIMIVFKSTAYNLTETAPLNSFKMSNRV